MIDIPGLEPRYQEIVEAILEPLGPGYSVHLFGSRARGTWRSFSDIDLLVVGDRPLPLPLLARLETAFEESELPVRVDLVDAQRASEDFVRAIMAEAI